MLKNSTHNIPFYLLLLLMFFPLMPYGVISVVTIVFALSTVIFYGKNIKNFQKNKRLKFLLINTLFFLILSVTLVYSDNFERGVKSLIRDLNLIIFPVLILGFFPKNLYQKLDNLRSAFIISNTLLLLYLIITVIIYYFQNKSLESFFHIPFRNLIQGKTYLDLHPTYLSLWFSISIFFLIRFINGSLRKIHKTALIFLCVFFYAFILLSAARTVFLALNIGLLYYFFTANNVKKRFNVKFAFLFVLSLLIIIISFTDTFKERFINEFNISKIKLPKGRKPGSLSIRKGIYTCDFMLVKENFLIGHGVGDIQDKLDSCYKSSYKSSVFKRRKIDSHNYYFYLTISGGVLVLLPFLYMIFYNFKHAYYYNKEYLIFLLLIVICCFTENLMARVHGSILFSILNAMFVFENMINIEKNKAD